MPKYLYDIRDSAALIQAGLQLKDSVYLSFDPFSLRDRLNGLPEGLEGRQQALDHVNQLIEARRKKSRQSSPIPLLRRAPKSR